MTGPQEALSAAYESWNAGDLDGYLRLYDEGIRLHGYSPEPMDKTQVRGFYESIFTAFGSPGLSFEEVLWDGAVCAIRFTMSGRHVGEFMGVPATGTAITLPGITIFAFPRRPGYRAVLTGRHAGTAGPAGSGAGARVNGATAG